MTAVYFTQEVLPILAGANDLECLVMPRNDRPGVWKYRDPESGLRIIKWSPDKFADARRRVERELNIITALQESGSIPNVVTRIVIDGKVNGFIIPYCEQMDTPAMPNIAYIAGQFAELHAVSLGIPYPPFGLNLPVLFEGHTFWLRGREILNIALNALEGKSVDTTVDLVKELITTLESLRPSLTSSFMPEEFCIIHGDIAKENIRIYEEHGVAKMFMFDFGEAVVGPVQHDLSRFSVSWKLSGEQEALLLNEYLDLIEQRMPFFRDASRFRFGFRMLRLMAEFDLGVLGPVLALARSPVPSKRNDLIHRIHIAAKKIAHTLVLQ